MKTPRFLIFFILSFALSGCSLLPGTSGSAGVFKSQNSGETFEPKITIDEKNDLQSASILSIAVDPNDHQRIYLGTEKSGMFVSENGGENWRRLNEAEKIYAIAIDPRNNDTLYATTVFHDRGKIVKSKDRGETWSDVYVEPQGENYLPALVIDSYDPDILYAGSTRGALYKTINGGENWMNIAEIKGPITKIALDAADTRNIYFLVFEKGVYKIDHSQSLASLKEENKSKRKINQLAGGAELVDLGSQFTSQMRPRYALTLVADPKKKDVIYVAGTGGILRSEDGGLTWEEVPTLEKSDSSSKSIPIRSLAIGGSDSEVIYFGARGTFYRSFDHGQSWQALEFQAKNAIEVLTLEPQNEKVIYLGVRKIKN